MSNAFDELKSKYKTDNGGKIKITKKTKENSIPRTYRIRESIDQQIKYLAEKYDRHEKEIVEMALTYFFDNLEE